MDPIIPTTVTIGSMMRANGLNCMELGLSFRDVETDHIFVEAEDALVTALRANVEMHQRRFGVCSMSHKASIDRRDIERVAVRPDREEGAPRYPGSSRERARRYSHPPLKPARRRPSTM